MAGRERKLTLILAGDASGATRAIDNLDRKTGTLSSRIGGLAKTAAIGFAGIAAGSVVVGKGFVEAAIESQKVTKQTEAVIKSMGDVAGVSAQQVADLSTSLSLKTGVDDEVIQSGQNVLLTFGNVKNAIGDGPKVFDRATQAALDMSVALGTDMNNAAMQVGKALNDPVRGLTALRRSGIQFSKQQEDQIKVMAEAGDVAGAQAIMLGELERQFGGSAAAQATSADKLKVAWGNVQEELGAKLLPVVEKVAAWMAAKLPVAMKAAGDAFDRIQPVIENVVDTVRRHWPEIQATIQKVIDHIRKVIDGFVSVATTLWENFGDNILEFVRRVWPRIQQVIQGAMDIIQGVIKTVTALIRGDWSEVWEGIKQIFSGVWEGIQGILGTALELIRAAIGAGLEIIGSVFKGAWQGMVDWFYLLPGKLDAIAVRVWNALKNGLKDAVDWVLSQLDRMLGPLDEILGKLARIPNLSLTGGAFSQDVIDRARQSRIPEHHSGGIFYSGRGEGLALLEDGEGVFTPRQMAALAPVGAPVGSFGSSRDEVVNVHLYLDGQKVAEMVDVANAIRGRNSGGI